MTASGAGMSASPWRVLIVFLKAVAFCGGGLAIGMRMSPLLLRLVSNTPSGRSWLARGVLRVMAWLAWLFGLAPLIGRFAAGLVIERMALHRRRRRSRARRWPRCSSRSLPISSRSFSSLSG